jgi:NADH-quinone oxidoreductase subunit A
MGHSFLRQKNRSRIVFPRKSNFLSAAEICLFAGYDPANHGLSGGLYANCLGWRGKCAQLWQKLRLLGLLLRRCWINQTGIIASPRESQVPEFLSEYLPIAIFFAIAVGLSAAFVATAFIFGNQRPDEEKMAAYECGFDAFEDSRRQFDVRFYLVAILFIIFDLEVAFLFPWAVSLGGIGLFGFWSMMVFLAVLTIGFIYEWKKGALEWE